MILLIGVGLLIANAFFVMAEFALAGSRRERLEEMHTRGSKLAGHAIASIDQLSLMLAGAQLGITMASLGLGFVAEPALARMIEAVAAPYIDLSPTTLHSISFALALTIVVYFHMVVGEMVPKNLAIVDAERSSLWLAIPFRAYVFLFAPVIRVLNWVANQALRLMRIEPKDALVSAASPEEIATIVKDLRQAGILEGFMHDLLTSAIRFRELDAEAVMVPRTDVVAASLDSTVEDLERVVKDTGRSRIPLYDGDVDHIRGFIHATDLVTLPMSARQRAVPQRVLREILATPGNRALPDLLNDMKRSHIPFAVVIDEHGGTDGIVTLEDVLEEITGEIRDEHDPAVELVRRLSRNRFLVDGGLRPDQLAEWTGIRLPDGAYETVAGYVMQALGRVPVQGDRVSVAGGSLEVRSMSDRQISEIEVRLQKRGNPSPAGD
jgi:CBS domain containing-hemolysin-like protein